MCYFADVGKLQKRCLKAGQSMVQEIKKAALDIAEDQKAWGQFLDYPQTVQQKGVYGTAAAVSTLILLGEPASSDFVTKGERWLARTYSEAKSRPNTKKDYAIIYKLCHLLWALSPGRDEIDNESEPLLDDLKSRKFEGEGWGEYFFSTDHRWETSGIIPTAVALYTLRRNPAFIGSEQCKSPIEWLQTKVANESDVSALEVALLAVVLHAYSERHVDLIQWRDSAVTLLEKRLRHDRGSKSEGDWYPHHFSVCDPDSRDWKNSYIYFPTDAIVITALMQSGRFWQNRRYVTRSLRWYLDNIERNEAFKQPQLRRISTVDQYWVALAIREFLDIDAKGRIASAWEGIRSRRWQYWLFVVLPLIVALAVIIFLSANTTTKSAAGIAYRILDAILGVTLSALIGLGFLKK